MQLYLAICHKQKKSSRNVRGYQHGAPMARSHQSRYHRLPRFGLSNKKRAARTTHQRGFVLRLQRAIFKIPFTQVADLGYAGLRLSAYFTIFKSFSDFISRTCRQSAGRRQ